MARLIRAALLRGPALLILLAAAPARAADPSAHPEAGRFVAACEDLGRFCFARACGRDQIAAAQGCRALCPSAAVLAVVPAACPLPVPGPVLRRRG